MHRKFDHEAIEKKWQKAWRDSGIYDIRKRDPKKEKEYVLVEWPYPSGNLHIGHWFTFAVTDIYVRAHRMQGRQVLFPIGFDAFGLPAENAAIKRNLDPKQWTEENISYMKDQFESMGNAFTWNMTTSSTDPEYYKWTQWMFTKFFEHDIAYKGTGVVNWCPGCNTVLANEQVMNGECERCGSVVVKKEMEEWKLRITKYADRLIDDLSALDWPEHIKEAQRQWIGRSEGAEIGFPVVFDKPDTKEGLLPVFTTRPDTLYGATYMVLSPEHLWVTLATDDDHDVLLNKDEIKAYVKAAKAKSEIDRTNQTREKTGVLIKGVRAINPATREEIPIFVADYVLTGYGTGAIMGVPAHDERDYAFAEMYDLPIKQVIVPCFIDHLNPPQEGLKEVKRETVIVFLRNNKTKSYALLDWHETLEGITTTVMGGIEDGQTPEEAVMREIEEEIAIPNARLVKKLPWITDAKYCASHKGQNRLARAHAYLYEIDDLTGQGTIPEKEQRIHTLRWVPEGDVEKALVPEHQKFLWRQLFNETAIPREGTLLNSETWNGMDSKEAKKMITEKAGGKMTNTYRLRDWSIGRQRYWGVPIPIVYDPEGKAHVIPLEHLPWHLPTDVDYKPTGEPPLAKSKELKERVRNIFGEGWTPEVETMDTFVDSSWYFLRYIDNANDLEFSSRAAQETWMPIDVYFGGAEHTTMHLLYSRFWQKALFDLGLVTLAEPYTRRVNRGLVLGPDGNKMSKSKGNVVDPDDLVKRLGADTVKMYLAFMGPYGEASNYPWDMGGIAGLRRFLERVYGIGDHITEAESEPMTKLLHKTIAKVTGDIEQYKFNTAISAMMIYINAAEREGLAKGSYRTFLKLLAAFAPHISDELWEREGQSTSIHEEEWPLSDPRLTDDNEVTIGVQINGKARGSITLSKDASEDEALALARSDQGLKERLHGEIEKVIYKPGKILNIIQK